MALCWFVLPRDRDGSPDVSSGSRLAQIDFLGAFFLGAGILALMLPLEIGGDRIPWNHPIIPALFGLGAALLLLFLATEKWWAKSRPIFPLSLFRQRDVITSYVVMGCQIAAQIGVRRPEGRRPVRRFADISQLMYSVPLYFQVTAGASNTVAGAHLFPAVAGNAVGGMAAGLLIKRSVNHFRHGGTSVATG